MTDLWLSGAFFQALNTPKLVFGRGCAPDTAGGAYEAPSRLGRGCQLGISLPLRHLRRLDLGAFGASVVRPPNINSWLRL